MRAPNSTKSALIWLNKIEFALEATLELMIMFKNRTIRSDVWNAGQDARTVSPGSTAWSARKIQTLYTQNALNSILTALKGILWILTRANVWDVMKNARSALGCPTTVSSAEKEAKVVKFVKKGDFLTNLEFVRLVSLIARSARIRTLVWSARRRPLINLMAVVQSSIELKIIRNCRSTLRRISVAVVSTPNSMI